MLAGVQRLLRVARTDPAQPAVTDDEVASMLELVVQTLSRDVDPVID